MMRLTLHQRMGWGLVPVLAALLVATVPVSQAQTAPTADSGLICSTSPNSSFALSTQSGYIGFPDGNSSFMWSYAMGGATGSFQLPGPTLCVTQNDTVTVTLTNTLSEDSSIVFMGIDGVQAGGQPVQPQFTSGTLTSLVQPATKSGGSVTYSFVAKDPGTYIYESGTDSDKQVQMGLYGMLVVRPSMGSNYAYNQADTQFSSPNEYMMMFSEVDPYLHQAVERGQAYDYTLYHPRYWLINGRSFPDTIAPNGAGWLPVQPQGALVHIRPKDASNPQPALVRYANVGTLNHPFHPHGMHGRVIARDGRVLTGAAGEDLSYEKFLILAGVGQTWDATYIFTDIEGWNPTTNPIPVTLPQLFNLTFKGNATWYSGSPYLGHQDDLPVGTTSYNQCGEYYMVWHSHALNEATNFDVGFGGLFTLQRIDPPLPNKC